MHKPYRECVVAVISNEKGCLLVGERRDVSGSWQLPQGGVDPGESPDEALFRELKEEIGNDKLELLMRLPEKIHYDFPADLHTGPAKQYRGQAQTWYHLKFKQGESPDLARSDGEFQALDWLHPEDILQGIVAWKVDAYKKGLSLLGFLPK